MTEVGVQIETVSGVTGVAGSVGGSRNIINPTINLGGVGDLEAVSEYLSPGRSRRDRTRLLSPDPRFVPPPGLPALVDNLQRDRVVLLSGPADAGLPSAAWYLVSELARRLDRDGVELTAEEVLLEKGLKLASQLDQDCLALVVNLSRGRLADLDELYRGLGRFIPDLFQHNGYLVAAIPADQQFERFAAEFPGRVHRVVSPPDPIEVFSRRLRGTDAESVAASAARHSWLRGELEGTWPPRVAHLARLIIDAYNAGQTDVDHAVAYARQLDEDWSGELHGLFTKHTDGQWRALLIAAAALKEAAPVTVVAAADLLLACAEHAPTETPALERPGVAERLDTLAEAEFDPQRARFNRPRFELSVLEHVWAEYPHMREILVGWFGRIVTEPLSSVDHRDLERFTDQIVQLSIRHGIEIVLGVAEQWANHNAKLSRSVAVRALGQAAVDPRIGWSVRQRLYDWAYQAGGIPRKRVVAEVCGGELGRRYPKVALVRLKHLSAEEDQELARTVSTAVVRIANQIGLPELLRLLTQSWTDHAASLVDAIRTVFAETDHRSWLVARRDRDIRAVIEFWQAALAHLAAPEITALVGTWLDRALTVLDPHRTTMVALLVTAAEGDLRRLGALGYAAARWPTLSAWQADTGGERIAAVTAQMRTQLDEIDPLLSLSDQEVTSDDD